MQVLVGATGGRPWANAIRPYRMPGNQDVEDDRQNAGPTEESAPFRTSATTAGISRKERPPSDVFAFLDFLMSPCPDG